MKRDHVYVWVIRSKKRDWFYFLERRYHYFASRTALKNPRYMTGTHHRTKFFACKADAETYYFAKMRKGFDLRNVKIMRKKIWIDKKGFYDYFKNGKALR